MIRLPYGYGIKADERQFFVGKIIIRNRKSEHRKEETLYNIASFDSITHCLKHIMKVEQRKIVDSMDLSLREAIIEINKIHKQFEDLLKKIIKEDFTSEIKERLHKGKEYNYEHEEIDT